MLNRRDDADDRVPLRSRVDELKGDTLTDRIGAGPVLLGEVLVDDRNALGLRFREIAASDDGNVERRQEALVDDTVLSELTG